MVTKIKELVDLSEKELQDKVITLKKDYFALKLQRSTGSVEKPANFKAIRQTIARIETILNERKNDGRKSK